MVAEACAGFLSMHQNKARKPERLTNPASAGATVGRVEHFQSSCRFTLARSLTGLRFTSPYGASVVDRRTREASAICNAWHGESALKENRRAKAD